MTKIKINIENWKKIFSFELAPKFLDAVSNALQSTITTFFFLSFVFFNHEISDKWWEILYLLLV